MVRHNNQLPDNLPQLQNLIKRDPASYREEFMQQYNHYLSLLEVFRLNPGQENKSLDELVMFIAQVRFLFAKKFKMFNKMNKKNINITKLPLLAGGTMLCRRIGHISTAIGWFTKDSVNNSRSKHEKQFLPCFNFAAQQEPDTSIGFTWTVFPVIALPRQIVENLFGESHYNWHQEYECQT